MLQLQHPGGLDLLLLAQYPPHVGRPPLASLVQHDQATIPEGHQDAANLVVSATGTVYSEYFIEWCTVHYSIPQAKFPDALQYTVHVN